MTEIEQQPVGSALSYDVRKLSRWIIGAAYIALVLEALTLAHSFAFAWIVDEINAGNYDEPVVNFIDAVRFVGFGYSAAFVLCIVLTLVWTYRVVRNADEIRPAAERISPGWAVGFWFIPIVSLWKPFQVMAQTWNTAQTPSRPMSDSASGWMRVWWGFWVVTNIVSQVSFRMWRYDEDYAVTWEIAYMDAFVLVLTIPMTWLFVRLVREISEGQAQHAKARMLGIGSSDAVDGSIAEVFS